MTLALTGHGVARGIAIGHCHIVVSNELEIGEHRIAPDEVEKEIQRYRDAVQAAREQLTELADRMDENVAVPASEIQIAVNQNVGVIARQTCKSAGASIARSANAVRQRPTSLGIDPCDSPVVAPSLAAHGVAGQMAA